MTMTRRLAAQLERDLGDVIGSGLHDLLADLRRTGDGDDGDLGIGGKRVARQRARSGDDVDDALGKGRLLDDLGKLVCAVGGNPMMP